MPLILSLLLLSAIAEQGPALRIVVIEGEDAVNIVQQNTAVRPLVEVRDRNNLPVAGATVTFTIGSGAPAAFAGGAQAITVTTNAAGQAAAGGLNALSSGAFQIQVQAAYQGQLATAAISQTNFATAAAASQAAASGAGGGAGGSSGGAAGSAAGGGGGISGTTIGIVGAAVAGGAVAAIQVAGGDEGDGDAERSRRFTTSIAEQYVVTTTVTSSGGTSTCVSTRALTGTITITLRNGNSNGNLETTGSLQEVSVSGQNCNSLPGTQSFSRNGDVTGGPSNLTYLFETVSSSTGTATVTVTVTSKFTGAVSGDTITGTFSYQESSRGTGSNNSTIVGAGQVNIAVTLR